MPPIPGSHAGPPGPAPIPGRPESLPAYIAPYGQHAKVSRLLHVASREGPMQLRAHQLVIEVLKSGMNTQHYLEVVSRARQTFGEALGDRWGLDQGWVDATNRRARDTMVRVETQVAQADRGGDKGAMFRATLQLAMTHSEQGGFSKAISIFFSCKKLLPSPADERAINLGVLRASIDIGTLSQVQSQAQRALQQAGPPAGAGGSGGPGGAEGPAPAWMVEATVALGLVHMKNKNYSQAAAHFLKAQVTEQPFSERVTPRDVVMYGCVCALASYSRSDLKERLLENDEFKKLVLDVAPHWLQLTTAYCNSDYAGCFSALAAQQEELLRDVFVGPQWRAIEGKIKDRALVLYFRPFSCVRLQSMADAFCVPMPEMERRLVDLISSDQIAARIDAQAKVLHSRSADARTASFEKALTLGDKYLRDVKSLLMRVSLAANNVVVRQKSDRGDHDKQMAAALAASVSDK